MIGYAWKDGGYITGKIDPQVAGKHLERLRRDYGGLTPELVVESAELESSPIHGAFEWDDTTAAEKYRLDQASELIRSVVIRSVDGQERDDPIRAFVVIDPGQDTAHYASMFEALSDEGLRRQVLDRALRELHVWERRYGQLVELAEILSAADVARKRVAV